MVKADFYGFFKTAYASAFTPNTIKSAFKATGIWPMDRSVVTTKFKYTTLPDQTDPQMGPSHLSPADWKRIERLLKEAVQQGTAKVAEKLSGAIHRATVQNKLLKLENEGLLASLDTQNKRTCNGRRLLFSGANKRPTDGKFWGLDEVEQARQIRH